VRAFEFFEENGRQFFVMEFIEGRTLESLIELLPPGVFFPLDHILDWARQLCAALHYLHSQTPPIIYRDLKPSNIMEVAGSHLLKLFDFGIARYYKPGQRSDTVRFGTDGYLAPEIIAYQTQTSKQTDVFALGAVLHQLLTRYDPQIDPWRRPSIQSVNPFVPANVLKAIEHALSLNPAARSPGADLVLRELFGNQAEVEITNVSMQNPFKRNPAPAEKVERPFEKTAGQIPQVQAPAPPAVKIDTTTYLDLGRVQQGQKATRQMQVTAPPAVTGRVTSSVSWLTAVPESISTADSRITVVADTRVLPLATWEASTKPGWFNHLPGLLRGWLGIHSSFFVPRPRNHQGRVKIFFPGVMESAIEVSLEVCPSSLAAVFGWLVVAGLISIEILLLLLMLLSVLLILF
jgi:serine/threonine protein kinase